MYAFQPLRTFDLSFKHGGVMKTAVLIIGLVAVLAGLLWVAQGAGIVHWPASSFMIDQRSWVFRGALLAIVGLVLLLLSRRR